MEIEDLKQVISEIQTTKHGWAREETLKRIHSILEGMKKDKTPSAAMAGYEANVKNLGKVSAAYNDQIKGVMNQFQGLSGVVAKHAARFGAVGAALNKVSNGADDAAGKLGLFKKYLGPAIGHFINLKFGFGALAFAMGRVIHTTISAYQDLRDMGISVTGGLYSLRMQASAAGVTFSEFSKIVRENSALIVSLSTNMENGIKTFARLSQMVNMEILGTFGRLGMTTEQITGYLVDYLEMQKTVGLLDRMTDLERRDATINYIRSLTEFSNLMGRSRQEIAQATRDQLSAAHDWQLYLLGIQDIDQRSVQSETMQMVTALLEGTNLGQLVPTIMELMTRGVPREGFSAELMALSPEIAEAMWEIVDGIETGLDSQNFVDILRRLSADIGAEGLSSVEQLAVLNRDVYPEIARLGINLRVLDRNLIDYERRMSAAMEEETLISAMENFQTMLINFGNVASASIMRVFETTNKLEPTLLERFGNFVYDATENLIRFIQVIDEEGFWTAVGKGFVRVFEVLKDAFIYNLTGANTRMSFEDFRLRRHDPEAFRLLAENRRLTEYLREEHGIDLDPTDVTERQKELIQKLQHGIPGHTLQNIIRERQELGLEPLRRDELHDEAVRQIERQLKLKRHQESMMMPVQVTRPSPTSDITVEPSLEGRIVTGDIPQLPGQQEQAVERELRGIRALLQGIFRSSRETAENTE